MRAIALLCVSVLALALAAPAGAEPARHEHRDAAGPYMLLAKKEDRDGGRGQQGRREERRGGDHENRGDRGFERRGRDSERGEYRERSQGHEGGRRSISRGEAAERAQRQAPGRVLGIQRQPDDEGYSVNVLDERGRLRVIRIPAEDE